MENKTKEEIGQGTAMTKEDFAALWKTIRLKVTDTYEVPPEILWVNGSTIGTLGNFSASTQIHAVLKSNPSSHSNHHSFPK